MKNVILILSIFFCYKYSFAQNNIINIIDSAIIGNTNLLINKYKKEFIQLDSNTQMLGLLYLGKYQKDSFLYENIDKIKLILEIYSLSKYIYIRQKAINILLDIYRLGANDIISNKFSIEDYDKNAKKRIIEIINNEPFNSVETELIYKINFNKYKKNISSNKYFINNYEKKSSLSRNELIDSLAKSFTDNYCLNIKPSLDNINNLLYLCSYLYITDAEYLIKDSKINNKYVLLARLNPSKYQKFVIDSMYYNNSYNYYELAFIKSKNAIKTMIDGLKLNERIQYTLGGFDKSGHWLEAEVESPSIKKINLYQLLSNKFLNLTPPFEIDPISLATYDFPESLCDDVAKWMEDNIDILQINPDFRYQ